MSSTRRMLRRLALSLLLLGTAAHAPAQVQNSLRDVLAKEFNDEDIRLFMDAWRKTLDEAPEQGTVSWENPATRNRGDLTVAASFAWQAHPCRRLDIVNEARGQKSRSSMSFCRIDDRWRAVAPSQLEGSRP